MTQPCCAGCVESRWHLFGGLHKARGMRDAQALSMVALGAIAWVTTPAALRRENDFTWGPMAEVATIFAGIFATMMPALVVRSVACCRVCEPACVDASRQRPSVPPPQ